MCVCVCVCVCTCVCGCQAIANELVFLSICIQFVSDISITITILLL